MIPLKHLYPAKKWSGELNRRFSKEDLQMAKGHMATCSSLLFIREMQSEATVRCHLKPVRMTIIKKSTRNKCWRGCGEQGTLLHCWWECKLVQPLWKTVRRFLQTLELPCDPEKISNLKRYTHPYVNSSTSHSRQDTEAT